MPFCGKSSSGAHPLLGNSRVVGDVSLAVTVFLRRPRMFSRTLKVLDLVEEMCSRIIHRSYLVVLVVGFFIFNHKITPSSTQKTTGLKIGKQRQNDIR